MRKGRNTGTDAEVKAYFAHIKNIPLLTFEEELEVSRHIHAGDEEARRRLIEANLRLVIKIARNYFISDVSLMDLIQEGNMGLIHAVDKYDYSRHVRFSTYAAWWIRQAITRYLSDKRRIIRIPHRKEEILRKIQQAYHNLSQLYMRQPTLEEISAEIGVPQGDVEFVLCLSHDTIPIESERANTSSAAIEIHEDHTYSPERMIIRETSRKATLKVLDRLKDREKRILIYRYQLYGGRWHSLRNIGDKMGISTETVRQIELKALQKLRGHAEDLQFYVEA